VILLSSSYARLRDVRFLDMLCPSAEHRGFLSEHPRELRTECRCDVDPRPDAASRLEMMPKVLVHSKCLGSAVIAPSIIGWDQYTVP